MVDDGITTYSNSPFLLIVTIIFNETQALGDFQPRLKSDSPARKTKNTGVLIFKDY